MINERIAYCKKVMIEYKEPLVYYTLAHLFNQDTHEYPGSLYKVLVRYYCIKAVCLDRKYAAAWGLLSDAYSFIALFGGHNRARSGCIGIKLGPDVRAEKEKEDISVTSMIGVLSEGQKSQIRCIEKAIYCVRQALKIEPLNEDYQWGLKIYYHQRNEEFKPEGVPRNLNFY